MAVSGVGEGAFLVGRYISLVLELWYMEIVAKTMLQRNDAE
jgi:hypothetical protein